MMESALSVDGPYQLVHVVEAFHDIRVQRALRIAMRDAEILREWRKRRNRLRSGVVLLELAADYGLSEEHIRSIVYRKLPALRVQRLRETR